MSIPVRILTPVGLSFALGVSGCCMGGGSTPTTDPATPGATPAADPGTLVGQALGGGAAGGAVGGAVGGGAGGVTPMAGPTQMGNLAAGDATRDRGQYQDVYTTALQAGQGYLIRADSSDFDSYLIVTTPSGQVMENDDHDGLNAGVMVPSAEAGTYQIAVSSWAPGRTGTYTLSLVPQAAAAPPGQVQNVIVAAGFMPDPMVVPQPVVAAGDVRGSDMAGVRGYCSGSYPASPQITVTVQNQISNLRFVARADRDIAMAIRFPDGHVECDDDSGGSLNPAITARNAAPGVYQVHVGSWSSGGIGASSTVAISENPGLRSDGF